MKILYHNGFVIGVYLKHYIVVAGNLIASGAAGGTALTVTYPFDVARTRYLFFLVFFDSFEVNVDFLLL